MKRLAHITIAALAAVLPGAAWGQGAVLQGGPWQPGHVPMYVGQGSAQPIIQDSGPPGGGDIGLGLSELLLTARGTGTPPYAGQGSGPLGTNLCEYDAPITNPAGYHFLCFSANAQGGALIASGSGGGAADLPLNININGVTFPVGSLTNFWAIQGNGSISNNNGAAVNVLGALNVAGNAAFDTSTLFVDAVHHRVGINDVVPGQTLTLVGDSLFFGSTSVSTLVGVNAQNADSTNLVMDVNAAATVLNARNSAITTSGSGNLSSGGHIVGSKGEAIHNGTGTLAFAVGLEGAVSNISTGTLTEAYAVLGFFEGNASGRTIANYYAFKSLSGQNNSGTITRWADFYSEDLGTGGSGTITARYSLLNEDALKIVYSAGKIKAAGDILVTGNTSPTIAWQPSSGSTKVGEIFQQGNVLFIADAGIANRISIDIATGNTVINGTLNTVGAYSANGTPGISCSGSPTAGFTSVNGIVTVC